MLREWETEATKPHCILESLSFRNSKVFFLILIPQKKREEQQQYRTESQMVLMYGQMLCTLQMAVSQSTVVVFLIVAQNLYLLLKY